MRQPKPRETKERTANLNIRWRDLYSGDNISSKLNVMITAIYTQCRNIPSELQPQRFNTEHYAFHLKRQLDLMDELRLQNQENPNLSPTEQMAFNADVQARKEELALTRNYIANHYPITMHNKNSMDLLNLEFSPKGSRNMMFCIDTLSRIVVTDFVKFENDDPTPESINAMKCLIANVNEKMTDAIINFISHTKSMDFSVKPSTTELREGPYAKYIETIAHAAMFFTPEVHQSCPLEDVQEIQNSLEVVVGKALEAGLHEHGIAGLETTEPELEECIG